MNFKVCISEVTDADAFFILTYLTFLDSILEIFDADTFKRLHFLGW